MPDRPRPPAPDTWKVGAVHVSDDVYIRLGPTMPDTFVWHWCPTYHRWAGWSVDNHTLVTADPLHLEASLLFPCCNRHGYIRGGAWQAA